VPILSIGANPIRRKITVKGARRASHVTRERALERDLARLNTGAPGGWRPSLALARRVGVTLQRARTVTWDWSTPTPPWPGGPKLRAAGGARRETSSLVQCRPAAGRTRCSHVGVAAQRQPSAVSRRPGALARL
jgi:hypothetical protein